MAHAAVCHGKEAIGGPVAPSLLGVWGRKAGSAAFSHDAPALEAAGLWWTAADRDFCIAYPQKRVPGARVIVSLPNAPDRRNVAASRLSLKRAVRMAATVPAVRTAAAI